MKIISFVTNIFVPMIAAGLIGTVIWNLLGLPIICTYVSLSITIVGIIGVVASAIIFLKRN